MSAFRVSVTTSAVFALLMASTVAGAPPTDGRELPGIVEGYVVDLNGNAVAGARVQIMAARSGELVTEFETGRAGTFQIRLWAGDYEARAGSQVFPSASKMFSIQADQTLRLKLILRERPVPSTGVLVCKVSDSSGEPIAGAEARAYSVETGEAIARFATSERGSWMAELKPGKYYLETGANEFETVWRTFVIEAGRLTELKIELKQRSDAVTGVLAGFVCDDFGYTTGGVPTFIYSNATGEVVSRFVADDGGSFRLQLKPGKYTLKTLSTEYTSPGAEFEISAGRVTELKIVLTPNR